MGGNQEITSVCGVQSTLLTSNSTASSEEHLYRLDGDTYCCLCNTLRIARGSSSKEYTELISTFDQNHIWYFAMFASGAYLSVLCIALYKLNTIHVSRN